MKQHTKHLKNYLLIFKIIKASLTKKLAFILAKLYRVNLIGDLYARKYKLNWGK